MLRRVRTCYDRALNRPLCAVNANNKSEYNVLEPPKNPNMSRKWLEFVGYQLDQNIKKSFRLCNDHNILLEHIRQTYLRPSLIQNAVLSLNGGKSEDVINYSKICLNELLMEYIDLEATKPSKVSLRSQRSEPDVMIWDPLNFFHSSNYKYALVVLNQPIYWGHDFMCHLWKKAEITATVDGGTNQWITFLGHKAAKVLDGKCKQYVPNIIVGDMDSVSLDILNKLKCAGATVIKMAQQDSTDYTKALSQLRVYCKENSKNLDGIYVLAETSGRFDHILGNINTLYKSDKLVGDIQVMQVASNSLTWLLRPGTHRIMIPDILVHCSSWCGLLPIGSSVTCTTNGLKWNLDHTSMKFGGLVSTSNTYSGIPEVRVTTDKSMIWTMGIEPLIETINNKLSS